ncbi:MAG: hypothetical protein ACQSGP_14060 [Frankia sp.]
MLEAEPVAAADPAAIADGTWRSGGRATVGAVPGALAERPFTALERTICLSDRPEAPIIVGLLARLGSRVDPDSLREATLAALARHPMARARRHPGPVAVAWWQFPVAPDVEPVTTITAGGAGHEVPDLPPAVTHQGSRAPLDGGGEDDHAAEAAFAVLCDQASDLTLSPALRVGLLRLPGSDAIGLVAHHAALDGAALLLLLTEILADCRVDARSSASATASTDTGTASTDAGAASTDLGTQAGGPGPSRSGRLRRGRPSVRPTGVRPRSGNRYLEPATTTPGRGYGVVAIDVPIPVPSGGATVNDLLMAAAHLAVERWNHARGRSTGVVRLRMPINMRIRAGAGTTDADDIGNGSGQATVVSTPGERVGPASLLAAVTRQTAAAKVPRSDGNPDPAGALWFVPPRARDRVARTAIGLARPFMMPSATVSNLGRIDPLAGPELTVTSLSFFPFAGLPQGLAIGVTGYGGRLRLGFSYHRALFDPAAAARFAALYATALSELPGD